jgi:hypothetical protein
MFIGGIPDIGPMQPSQGSSPPVTVIADPLNGNGVAFDVREFREKNYSHPHSILIGKEQHIICDIRMLRKFLHERRVTLTLLPGSPCLLYPQLSTICLQHLTKVEDPATREVLQKGRGFFQQRAFAARHQLSSIQGGNYIIGNDAAPTKGLYRIANRTLGLKVVNISIEAKTSKRLRAPYNCPRHSAMNV